MHAVPGATTFFENLCITFDMSTPFPVHYQENTIINANLKLINATKHSSYSINIH